MHISLVCWCTPAGMSYWSKGIFLETIKVIDLIGTWKCVDYMIM